MSIFKIRRDEKWLAILSTIVFGLLNTLTVARYYGSFSQLTDNYHKLFVRTFHVSGFDPLTYEVLSRWDTAYNVYRHPLLAFFMYPFNQINQALMIMTGQNWATIVTAIILVACSVYSCLFLFRIVRELIGVGVRRAYLLCAYYFSFSFVMLSTMVPDHFVMSMMMLLLTIYYTGRKMQEGTVLNKVETIVLFTVTAGISLNNGLKVFLAALFSRGKKFFNPIYMIMAVLLPAGLMWGFARWEYKTFVWPKEHARHVKKIQKSNEATAQLRTHIADSLRAANVQIVTHDDSLMLNGLVKKENQKRAVAKYKADHKKIWNRNTGKPIAKGEFSRWTDITTPRWDTAVENLFGEGIILHEDHVLGDVLRDRPVIVRYRNYANYVWEAAIVLMFLAGIWYGRRSRLLWTVMSFFLMDMALHVGLGFGINEIYIMSPHYLFALPIATAFIIRYGGRRTANAVTSILLLATIYCWAWNVFLIILAMA